jgi:hypothetical protein
MTVLTCLSKIIFDLGCLGLTFNDCSCERKPQEVVRILAKWGEAWLPV